jgi:hypothetical protein
VPAGAATGEVGIEVSSGISVTGLSPGPVSAESKESPSSTGTVSVLVDHMALHVIYISPPQLLVHSFN